MTLPINGQTVACGQQGRRKNQSLETSTNSALWNRTDLPDALHNNQVIRHSQQGTQ